MDGNQVERQIELIRSSMPKTYRAIRDKAAEIGNDAYRLVKQGIKGQAGCFYACEGGHVVGTPFEQTVTAEVAQLIVQFGMEFLVLWPAPEARPA